jgi:hypothetical protein
MKKTIYRIGAVLVVVGIAVFVSGCDFSKETDSYTQDAEKVEETQQKVQEAVPIPKIQNSAERKNIADRAMLFDDVNKNTYIYLINYGKVMAFYTVRGKVSSLNSYLSPVDKLVKSSGETCTWENTNCYVVGAPDIDGAYGENADGIFFFTTEGAYVEWKGDYMVSDQPLKLQQQPELIQEVK